MDENSMDSVPENTMNDEEVKPADFGTEQPEDILLTADGQKFLNQTRPWVRFMSIMIFIGAAFTLLGGLMIILVGLTGNLFGAGRGAFDQLPGGGFAVGFLYLVLAFYMCRPEYFCPVMRRLLKLSNQPALPRRLRKR